MNLCTTSKNKDCHSKNKVCNPTNGKCIDMYKKTFRELDSDIINNIVFNETLSTLSPRRTKKKSLKIRYRLGTTPNTKKIRPRLSTNNDELESIMILLDTVFISEIYSDNEDQKKNNEYKNIEQLNIMCISFIGKTIKLSAIFNDETIVIKNPNLVGDLIEEIVFPFYKKVCPDFELGSRQSPPDFFGQNKEFQFELKVFKGFPSFDISNFTSLIHQISKNGGLKKKLFKTKYLIYEYDIKNEEYVFKNFWLLNIWNLPVYDKKYPLSMQVKKKMWYNMRPGPSFGWTDNTKTPERFIVNLLKCIEECAQIENKTDIKLSILSQIEQLKIEGFL